MLVEGVREVRVDHLPRRHGHAQDAAREPEVQHVVLVYVRVRVGLEGGAVPRELKERVVRVEQLAREHFEPLAREPACVHALLPVEVDVRTAGAELVRRVAPERSEGILEHVLAAHADGERGAGAAVDGAQLLIEELPLVRKVEEHAAVTHGDEREEKGAQEARIDAHERVEHFAVVLCESEDAAAKERVSGPTRPVGGSVRGGRF